MKDIIIKAPGRTCLFGDHQDYLGLPIIACAIDRHITLKAEKNSYNTLVLNKPDIGEQRIIDLSRPIDTVEKGDYLLAAMKVLEGYGCFPKDGYTITISGNLPINAGTSSSSAVIIAWVRFLLSAYGCGHPVDNEFIAKVAYEAEVVFHGFPGGKMDHYSIGLGNIIYLETSGPAFYETFDVKLPGLIVAESGIPKETTGVLGQLKEKALLAIDEVSQKVPEFDIKTITPDDLPKYGGYVSDDLKIYFKAAVLNHDVTQRALKEFRKPHLDYEKVGDLINQHHQVLRDDLEITLPLIDNMVDGALAAGALGAKIVGSGRGGSIVVLAKEGEEDKIITALKLAGAKDAYAVQVDSGVRVIEQN